MKEETLHKLPSRPPGTARKNSNSQHAVLQNSNSRHAFLLNSNSQHATRFPLSSPPPPGPLKTTVPSMQRHPQLLVSRWILLRRYILFQKAPLLNARPSLGNVSAARPWPPGPARTDFQAGDGAQAAQALRGPAPAGSSRGPPPFERRWRAAGGRPPAPRREGPASSMAAAAAPASRPCSGGPRDLVWLVSAAAPPVPGRAG